MVLVDFVNESEVLGRRWSLSHLDQAWRWNRCPSTNEEVFDTHLLRQRYDTVGTRMYYLP